MATEAEVIEVGKAKPVKSPLAELPEASAVCPTCGQAVPVGDGSGVEWVTPVDHGGRAGRSLPVRPIPTLRCSRCAKVAGVAADLVAAHPVLRARWGSAAGHRVECMAVALSQVESGWRRRLADASDADLVQLVGLFSGPGAALRFASLLVPVLRVSGALCSRRPWSHWQMVDVFGEPLEALQAARGRLMWLSVNGPPQASVKGVPAIPDDQVGLEVRGQGRLLTVPGGCMCCGVDHVVVAAGREPVVEGPATRGVTLLPMPKVDPEVWLDRQSRISEQWRENRWQAERRGDDPDVVVGTGSLPPRESGPPPDWQWRQTDTRQLGVGGRVRPVAGWVCSGCSPVIGREGWLTGCELLLLAHVGDRRHHPDLGDHLEGCIPWAAHVLLAGGSLAANAERFGHLGDLGDLRERLRGS